MQVKDIMSRHVTTVDPDEPLSRAVQAMLWAGVRHLPVVEGGKLVGMLSERDILRHRATGLDEPMRSPVRDAMTRPAKFIHPDDSITEAAGRMVGDKLSCLPVVMRGDLVGIITSTDLLTEHVREAFRREAPIEPTAQQLMTTEPLTAHEDDHLLDAIAKMSQAGVRHLPVVDGDGRLVGMLLDRDLRLPGDWSLSEKVAERTHVDMRGVRAGSVMNTDVPTVKPEAPLSLLLAAFVDWRLGAVAVVDDQQHLLGVVSYIDVLRAQGGLLS